MPFKTGLGTAGRSEYRDNEHYLLFQCPLRRAWVLREQTMTRLVRQLNQFQCPLRRAWVCLL